MIPARAHSLAALAVAVSALPAPASPQVFYSAPQGDDAATGASTSQPWKTFGSAFSKMLPGDSLILLDGTYTLADNGSVYANCYGGAPQGPVVVRAANERRAVIQSDGSA